MFENWKEKLKLAVKAAIIAFLGALFGGALAPEAVQKILAALGM